MTVTLCTHNSTASPSGTPFTSFVSFQSAVNNKHHVDSRDVNPRPMKVRKLNGTASHASSGGKSNALCRTQSSASLADMQRASPSLQAENEEGMKLSYQSKRHKRHRTRSQSRASTASSTAASPASIPTPSVVATASAQIQSDNSPGPKHNSSRLIPSPVSSPFNSQPPNASRRAPPKPSPLSNSHTSNVTAPASPATAASALLQLRSSPKPHHHQYNLYRAALTARMRASPEGRWALQVGPRLAIAMRDVESMVESRHRVEQSASRDQIEDVVMVDSRECNPSNEDWEMVDCCEA